MIRLDASDAAGKAVFTEHIGAMMRGVTCGDGGRSKDAIPPVPRRPEEGRPEWESVVPIDPLAPFIYDGCTNIHFPIHTSVKFARQVGLPGIIHQGTSTLALAVRKIMTREAGGDSTRLDTLYCRFTGMVMPGSDIRVRCTGKINGAEGTDIFFVVLNSQDQRAISDGHIRLK